MLTQLRRFSAPLILGYFWFCAVLVMLAGLAFDARLAAIALPLGGLGVIVSVAVRRNPVVLRTRLLLTLAINATWMFGLYAISGVGGGEFMLEMHMMYFINTSVILALACWRSVLFTSVAALAHHLALSIVAPEFVWQSGQLAAQHIANHAALAVVNCSFGVIITQIVKRALYRLSLMGCMAEHRATHDGLTGLLNRRGIEGAIADGPGETGVLLLDLDRFKQINETGGYWLGDALLVAVADRLRETAPSGARIARLAADEFAVALPGATLQTVRGFAEAMRDWAAQPLQIRGRELRFGASVGVALGRRTGPDAGHLMEDASIALTEAKERGAGRVAVFDSEMRRRAMAHKRLADDIVRGLEAGEFRPFFQAQYELPSRRIIGFEALVRWVHPKRGILPPSDFLSVAADLGLMQDIDAIILRDATASVRRLEADGFDIPRVSVNVSFARLMDPGLIREIEALPPMRARLGFEIVESVLCDALGPADLMALDRLRDLGVALELDDFGTGHASLIGLATLRPDLVKIDRALVSNIETDPAQVGLLSAISDMAQQMGVDTLVEGVERQAQLRLLSDMGFRRFQGFLFGSAADEAALRALLNRARAVNE